MTLAYVSYTQLIQDTLAWCDSPDNRYWRNCLGVVGIPKSGMIPAQVIASRFNLPLSDIDTFLLKGFYSNHGGRSNQYQRRDYDPNRPVLVVDDSVHGGATLRVVEEEIRNNWSYLGLPYEVVAVYGTGHCKDYRYYKDVPVSRIFEWNWTKHPMLEDSFLDMDGVLCEDWKGPSDTSEKTTLLYERWLVDVEPLYLPTRKVRAIASARIEKYRPQTEEWLRKWGVEYDTLHLCPLTRDELLRDNSHWVHKAQVYGESASYLFIESDPDQAERIAAVTSKTVFCPPCPTLGREGKVYRG